MPQSLKNMENSGEIVLYQPDDDVHLEVRLDNEMVWLTQQQKRTVSKGQDYYNTSYKQYFQRRRIG